MQPKMTPANYEVRPIRMPDDSTLYLVTVWDDDGVLIRDIGCSGFFSTIADAEDFGRKITAH